MGNRQLTTGKGLLIAGELLPHELLGSLVNERRSPKDVIEQRIGRLDAQHADLPREIRRDRATR
jgi:hypothetical protein